MLVPSILGWNMSSSGADAKVGRSAHGIEAVRRVTHVSNEMAVHLIEVDVLPGPAWADLSSDSQAFLLLWKRSQAESKVGQTITERTVYDEFHPARHADLGLYGGRSSLRAEAERLRNSGNIPGSGFGTITAQPGRIHRRRETKQPNSGSAVPNSPTLLGVDQLRKHGSDVHYFLLRPVP